MTDYVIFHKISNKNNAQIICWKDQDLNMR